MAPPQVRHPSTSTKKSLEPRPLSKVVRIMPRYNYKHDFAADRIQHAFRRWYKNRYNGILSNAQDIDPLTRDHVYEIPRANLGVWTVQTRPRRNLNSVVASSLNTTMRGYATTDLAMSLLCSTTSSFFHPGLQCAVLPQHVWYVIQRVREYLGVLKRQCEAMCPVATGRRPGPPSVFGEPLHLIAQHQYVADVLKIIVYRNEMTNRHHCGGGRCTAASSMPFQLALINKKKVSICNELVRVFTQFAVAANDDGDDAKPATATATATATETAAATAASKRRKRKAKAAAAVVPPPPKPTSAVVFFNPAEISESCEAQNLFDVDVDIGDVIDDTIAMLRANGAVNVIDYFDVPIIENESSAMMSLYTKVTTGC